MEFLYDEPIRYTEDDLLNRTNFAKDFALNILSIPKHKSMTISIIKLLISLHGIHWMRMLL